MDIGMWRCSDGDHPPPRERVQPCVDDGQIWWWSVYGDDVAAAVEMAVERGNGMVGTPGKMMDARDSGVVGEMEMDPLEW